MFERMKLGKPAASPLEDLLNAEKLLAYDPGNLEFMHRMQKAAVSGGFTHAASWIEEIIRKAQPGFAP